MNIEYFNQLGQLEKGVYIGSIPAHSESNNNVPYDIVFDTIEKLYNDYNVPYYEEDYNSFLYDSLHSKAENFNFKKDSIELLFNEYEKLAKNENESDFIYELREEIESLLHDINLELDDMLYIRNNKVS